MNTITRCCTLLLLSSLASAQWTKVAFPTTEFLWKVRFADAQTGWVAGHNHIFRTTNGGQTWSAQDTSIGSVDALAVIDANTAVFANWTGAGEKSRGIRRTTNGGTTWVTADSQKNYYSDMEFPTASIGYASSGGTTGNARLVKKTTDGGATWTTVSQNFPKGSYELTGIAFPDAQNGWAVTYDGFVYRTTNGGTDWTYQDSLGSLSFRDIGFANSTHGWAVGGIAGTMELFRTTNGGVTWTRKSMGGSSTREVTIVDTGNVWICGSVNSAPFIARLQTSTGAWQTQDPAGDLSGVESMDMVTASVGYAVGSQGKVYKTINGGVLSVRPERTSAAPAGFSLGQNFPNPFNPSTTVRFSLPDHAVVSLKVYSIAGELCDVLHSGPLEAGSYTVQWNAGARASGIYFYTLTAGAHTETKRMVLMK